jgi:hypothetical protein
LYSVEGVGAGAKVEGVGAGAKVEGVGAVKGVEGVAEIELCFDVSIVLVMELAIYNKYMAIFLYHFTNDI